MAFATGGAAASAWLAERERGGVMLLRFMVWLTRCGGPWPARCLLVPISLFYLLIEARVRGHSRDYLARVLGRPPTLLDLFRHIHCFATVILDRVFLLRGGAMPFRLDLADETALLERIGRGEGCLLLGAHLGSFDVLRTLAVGVPGVRLKVLMREAHAAKLTRLLAALNPAVAATVIGCEGPAAALRVKEWLAEGCLVALLGDRFLPGERTVRCRFLGAPAAFPTAPIQLAAALGAPILLFSGLRRAGGYEARFSLLAEAGELPGPRDEPAIALWVQRYADRLEALARRAPFNWFNFYPFWAP